VEVDADLYKLEAAEKAARNILRNESIVTFRERTVRIPQVTYVPT
jgi:hypothetical protein